MKDETALLVLFGLWLLSKWEQPEIQEPLQRGGARLYDLSHADSGHHRDLPRPERMLAERRARVERWATEAGFQGDALHIAIAVALAESGGLPDTMDVRPGGSGPPGYRGAERSVGVWRINTLAHPQYSEEWLRDPMNNARAAYAISKQGTDWSSWSAFTNGSYRRFMQ